MSTEFGIRINASASGRNGHEPQGGSGSRRQHHQRKLKALVDALDAGDLVEARLAYRLLLEFSPALEHSNFARVGQSLASANLTMARKVIEEIYGQSQAIFRHPAPATPAATNELALPTSRYFGVLVDRRA